MRLPDKIRFWTESPESKDFGKSWDDWKASKDAESDFDSDDEDYRDE